MKGISVYVGALHEVLRLSLSLLLVVGGIG